MKKNRYNNSLKESLKRGLHEISQRQYVREAVIKSLSEYIRENYLKPEKSGLRTLNDYLGENAIISEAEEDNNTASKRKTVMALLKDKKYDHAQLAYELWHPKDDSEKATCRSLFSKMANGTPDAEGTVREFDDKDIVSLYQILRKK